MLKQFSATVYVVNMIDGEPKVLLHLHKKHHHWFGLGGHVEDNEDPVTAARREAKEEAGITVNIFRTKKMLLHAKYADELIAPVLLFDQQIDESGDKPEHRHIDCIYYGTTPDPALVTMEEPFQWFSFKDLDSVEINDDTRYIAKGAILYFKSNHYS